MKYAIWAGAFLTYVLVFVGVLSLANNLTKGTTVEMDVIRQINGQTIVRKESVEFNEIPIVKWTFGMSGLLITICGGYAAAYSLSKSWGNEDDRKMTKIEKAIWVGALLVFFFVFSFACKVHTIFEVFTKNGLLFMVATCVGANTISSALCKLVINRSKAVENARPLET